MTTCQERVCHICNVNNPLVVHTGKRTLHTLLHARGLTSVPTNNQNNKSNTIDSNSNRNDIGTATIEIRGAWRRKRKHTQIRAGHALYAYVNVNMLHRMVARAHAW